MPFVDGDPPPDAVIDQWFKIAEDTFKTAKDSCIAVHCVAGLGRSVAR